MIFLLFVIFLFLFWISLLCRNIQVVDITTATTVSEDLSTAILSVDVDFTVEAGEEGSVQCVLTLLDSLGTETVAEDFSCKGQLEIQKPQLWWPYLMSETPGLNKESFFLSPCQPWHSAYC